MKCNLLLVAYSLLFSLSAHAAKVTSLKVEGNIVIFTESGTKTAAVPACASANPTKWGLSLITDSDRATYSVLVAAMASNMEVSIISAQQCVDGTSIEKIKAIEVLPPPVAVVEPSFKIVAVGMTDNFSAYVSATKLNANNQPYMYVSSHNSKRLECRAPSYLISTYDSQAYKSSVLCVK